MKESDIVHQNGRRWVYRDRKRARYTVFTEGVTVSVSDSSYALTLDGLSLACARADYLAGRDLNFWGRGSVRSGDHGTS